jgi:hypothetical protein
MCRKARLSYCTVFHMEQNTDFRTKPCSAKEFSSPGFCMVQGDGGVIRCLKENSKDLTVDCKAELFDHMTRMSEDIDFNKPLKDSCSAEIKDNCANVKPGHSRVIRCLQDGERDKYSDKCKGVRVQASEAS